MPFQLIDYILPVLTFSLGLSRHPIFHLSATAPCPPLNVCICRNGLLLIISITITQVHATLWLFSSWIISNNFLTCTPSFTPIDHFLHRNMIFPCKQHQKQQELSKWSKIRSFFRNKFVAWDIILKVSGIKTKAKTQKGINQEGKNT